jgi:hypothetical protein
MRGNLAKILLVLPCALGCGATEVSTGFLLGTKYDQRAFYIRSGPDRPWQKSYTGREYKRQAQGKLMNLRLAQALFRDEWLQEVPFDPEKNTGAVVAALDFYKSHGVLMINASLQGGQAGYDKKINGVDRQNGYKFGPEKGTHVSAFRADGSLKPDWLARLDRLLGETDRRGMVVNLMYFYQGQDELFESTEAIHAAARNITDWLIGKNHRNVIIDVANEWDLSGNRWDFDAYIPKHVLPLMDEVRERFQRGKAGFALPVGVSGDGRMEYSEPLALAADLVLVHGNGSSVARKTSRAAELRNIPRPILMNEDDNGRPSTTANLAKELASCTVLFEKAAGWGYMPWVQAQRFPFRYLPAASAAVRDDMPEAERDMVYFHAVLDHIAKLVMARPPHPEKGR